MKDGSVEKDIVTRLAVNGWALYLALAGASLFFLPMEFAHGVLVGGFLVVVNLTLLYRAVVRALALGPRITPRMVLPKFYLCFLTTAAILFVLISRHLVNELGLLLGLSVFIAAVFLVVARLAGRILYRTIILKEAV